jgi:hypothetical protein
MRPPTRMPSALSIVLAAAFAVALVVAVAARGDLVRTGQYFGAYVAPGQGGHTGYSDGCSSWWTSNKAVWPGGDTARVTFIDVGGGWHHTVKSPINPVVSTISTEQSRSLGRTKERCENASDAAVYFVACYFISDNFTNCV